MEDEYYDEDCDNGDYRDFEGSYAQDYEGYSDDSIYDAFDGEDDAYWNID